MNQKCPSLLMCQQLDLSFLIRIHLPLTVLKGVAGNNLGLVLWLELVIGHR
jgi:hypothetical protein